MFDPSIFCDHFIFQNNFSFGFSSNQVSENPQKKILGKHIEDLASLRIPWKKIEMMNLGSVLIFIKDNLMFLIFTNILYWINKRYLVDETKILYKSRNIPLCYRRIMLSIMLRKVFSKIIFHIKDLFLKICVLC